MLNLPPGLLQQVSGYSTLAILVAFAVHLVAFFWLMSWASVDLRRIARDFDEFTRDLKHRSLFDRRISLSDQIEAFLADIRDVVGDDTRVAERQSLSLRLTILDERRTYLQSHSFDTAYNICRTMIEAYPLAGVLGTILAIGSALQLGEGEQTLNAIVQFFGDAIWSTFAGLIAAIVLMFLNAIVEPRFSRLAENREHVRETIALAKRELAILPGSTSGPAGAAK